MPRGVRGREDEASLPNNVLAAPRPPPLRHRAHVDAFSRQPLGPIRATQAAANVSYALLGRPAHPRALLILHQLVERPRKTMHCALDGDRDTLPRGLRPTPLGLSLLRVRPMAPPASPRAAPRSSPRAATATLPPRRRRLRIPLLTVVAGRLPPLPAAIASTILSGTAAAAVPILATSNALSALAAARPPSPKRQRGAAPSRRRRRRQRSESAAAAGAAGAALAATLAAPSSVLPAIVIPSVGLPSVAVLPPAAAAASSLGAPLSLRVKLR
mmetsp:Transcript_97781/g.280945  ORF Transcript_97781/g.280945 Transcript_97781/m.280945 type:complete len:271 (+) Transcript_97781:643-1455(+)